MHKQGKTAVHGVFDTCKEAIIPCYLWNTSAEQRLLCCWKVPEKLEAKLLKRRFKIRLTGKKKSVSEKLQQKPCTWAPGGTGDSTTVVAPFILHGFFFFHYLSLPSKWLKVLWAPSRPERSVGHRSAIFHWVLCPTASLTALSFDSLVPAGKASADENCRSSYILNGWCLRNEPKAHLWGSLFKNYFEQNICRSFYRQKVGEKNIHENFSFL